jgi:hypothetical protein
LYLKINLHRRKAEFYRFAIRRTIAREYLCSDVIDNLTPSLVKKESEMILSITDSIHCIDATIYAQEIMIIAISMVIKE